MSTLTTDPTGLDLEELKPTFDPETQNVRGLDLDRGFAVIQQGGSSRSSTCTSATPKVTPKRSVGAVRTRPTPRPV